MCPKLVPAFNLACKVTMKRRWHSIQAKRIALLMTLLRWTLRLSTSKLSLALSNSKCSLSLIFQDPGFVADDYTGPLQPGWLSIQWIKINNLTSTLVNNPFFTPADAVASGGGFGLE